jgi:hypothetical protein
MNVEASSLKSLGHKLQEFRYAEPLSEQCRLPAATNFGSSRQCSYEWHSQKGRIILPDKQSVTKIGQVQNKTTKGDEREDQLRTLVLKQPSELAYLMHTELSRKLQ